MKIKPQIYAQLLLSTAKDENADLKKVAKNFWFTLQRNKQHRDLKEILEYLDREAAKDSNCLYVKAFSEKELSPEEVKEIAAKIKKIYGKEAVVKNIVKPGTVAGVIVKIDDRQIDLSLNGKLNQINKLLKIDTLETK